MSYDKNENRKISVLFQKLLNVLNVLIDQVYVVLLAVINSFYRFRNVLDISYQLKIRNI